MITNYLFSSQNLAVLAFDFLCVLVPTAIVYFLYVKHIEKPYNSSFKNVITEAFAINNIDLFLVWLLATTYVTNLIHVFTIPDLDIITKTISSQFNLILLASVAVSIVSIIRPTYHYITNLKH